jgi:hypothetical protein
VDAVGDSDEAVATYMVAVVGEEGVEVDEADLFELELTIHLSH